MKDTAHEGGGADGERASSDEQVALLGDVVEKLPVGIYRTTLEGEFVAVNDEFVALLGADSREALFEHDVTDFYVDGDAHADLLETLETEGAVSEYELALETLSGDHVWVTTTVARVEEDGRPYVEGALRDVTEHKRAEADSWEYRSRLTQVAESSQDVLWLFTADFDELLFVNEAYEAVWRRPVEELEQDPTQFLESVHEDDRGDVVDAMGALGEGEAIDVEYRILTPDDEVRWVWSKGTPVLDDAGDVYRVAGFTRDVTERRRTEDQLAEYRERLEATVTELRRSNEELEQFAYVASHDLQEPLRMVSSYVDLLAAEYEGELDEEADEYIAFAVDGARRMKAMINGLLAYSRVHTEAGEFDVVDGEAVVDSVLSDLRMRIEEADATVAVGDLPAVEADPSQLRQVLQNLLANALTHGGDAPSIHVEAEDRGDELAFSVTDDGPGIDPASQEAIFEIFTRGPDRDADGSGIGLAVCRRIVERHGGEIDVDAAPGEGTTFTFTLAQPPDEAEGSNLVDPEVVDA